MYLSQRNLKTTRPMKKLDYKKVGPFRILDVIGPVNYKLQLPDNMRINPVFHVSLLEPATEDAPTIAPQLAEEENEIVEYEVEEISDHQYGPMDRLFYRIKWKGYGPEDETWEPEENLQGSQLLLRQYRKLHPETRPRSDPRGRTARRAMDLGQLPRGGLQQ